MKLCIIKPPLPFGWTPVAPPILEYLAALTRQAIEQEILDDALHRLDADPDFAQGKTITVREVLDNAAAKVAGAFSDNPLLEAAIACAISHSWSLACTVTGSCDLLIASSRLMTPSMYFSTR